MDKQFLSQRVLGIEPSPSIAANALVTKLRTEGKDIINLTVGEPDLDTPEHILEAAKKAMFSGDTHYTSPNGTPALLKAIVAKLKRDNKISYETDEVIVGVGGKHIIYHAMAATLNEGDEVVVHAPYWVSYPDIAKLNQATPVIIPGNEANGFKLTADELERAITANTKWVILNTPNNPSGAVYTAAELNALADVVRRHPHVLVMSDEIYEHFVFTQAGHVSLIQIAPDLKNRTLLVNGASKGYAMTGWRIGFGAGPQWLIAAISKLLSQTTTCPTSISQAAAVAAFGGDQSPIAQMREIYADRRQHILGLLADVPGISFTRPDGAFYVFVNVSGLIGKHTPDDLILETDSDVVAYLLRDGGVATVGGAAYGMSPYIRVSFASSMELIQEGCARIRRACLKLR